MEPRISLITLGVADLPRSIRFYQAGLGWPRSSVGGDAVAFFSTGGVVLAMLSARIARGRRRAAGRGERFRWDRARG